VILRLQADTPEEIARLGGKGCGLLRLLRAGFAIPEAHCLPADESPRESELRGLWSELARAEEPCLLAVRSSATVEDLAEASAAGVYQTVLGVDSADALVAAVERCRDAFQAQSARAYRRDRGLDQRGGLALIIQRMLAPELAGVLLSANPQRPFASEVVIDAAYGLGEGVVSGRCDPDHLVLDRRTGAIREERIGAKAAALGFETGRGLVENPVDRASRARRCLGEAQLAGLLALARQLDARIGPRRDCEWAFQGDVLYLLQDRPITGLPPEHPTEVWTRKFGDEYLSDCTTPITHGFLTRWISEWTLRDLARLLGREDLAAMDPIRRYRGYTYLSGGYVKSSMRSVPRRFRAEGTRGWFTPLWLARIAEEPFELRALWRAARLSRMDPRAPMRKSLEVLRRHCHDIERAILPRLAQDYAGLSHEQWTAQLAEVEEYGSEHFRVIRWGMGHHNPLMHGLLQMLLRRWAGDADGRLYQPIVSGLPGTRTAEINRDLWRLGERARSQPDFAGRLRRGLSCDELRADGEPVAFWGAFDAFMGAHGHRADSREVSRPRWRESPDLVLALVRAQLRGDSHPADPRKLERAAEARREEAEREALRRAGSGVLGPLRARILAFAMRQARLFTAYRENQRYHLDYLIAHLRGLLLEQGRRLAGAGVLDEPSAVFFLEAEELRAVAEAPVPSSELREAVEERRDQYRLWKDRLPATYLFDEVETEGEIAEGDPPSGEGAGAGDGLGAARGIACGSLRVISEITSLDRIERGDILVAESIDPAWTSVFPLLGGLVTETGGVLSHGAILAREYGIPAVMGVAGATRRFETGTRVEIDGSSGRIRLLDENW
jgi:pyruvate,water dikinase